MEKVRSLLDGLSQDELKILNEEIQQKQNETVTSMQVAVDENGEGLFKAEEYLDPSQIKSLFYTMYVLITCFHESCTFYL